MNALARARPDRAEALVAGATRLVADDAMGTLFKVVAMSTPGLPIAAGFPSEEDLHAHA